VAIHDRVNRCVPGWFLLSNSLDPRPPFDMSPLPSVPRDDPLVFREKDNLQTEEMYDNNSKHENAHIERERERGRERERFCFFFFC
jgi:hypothetical protein